MEKLRVLIVAPGLDGGDIGEVYSAFQWVEALSRIAKLTVLTTSREGVPLAQQLPLAEVVTWPEPRILYRNFERFNAIAKPWMPVFGRKVKSWVRAALARGQVFDIAHQILPQGMRHVATLYGLGIPYVFGPLGGGLQTPPGFLSEVNDKSLFARLRGMDQFRLRHDRRLRASYSGAELLLGVAPYVGVRLAEIGLGNIPFQPVLERAHGALPTEIYRPAIVGQLKLLHVGRAIRTKGLRDTVRAMAYLRDLPGVTLTSAGDGDDLAECRREAENLGVADRVTFLGRIPRAAVDVEYAAADVFCFPSFREPMGGVFFEAMAHGLPIITAARGGPYFIVDDTSGIRILPETPEKFAWDISVAVRKLALDPDLRQRLGHGARARLISFGTWDDKAEWLLNTYHDILQEKISGRRDHAGAAAGISTENRGLATILPRS